MTTWVIRDGELVDKATLCRKPNAGLFPTPMLSHMEPFISPITDTEITSWGARDRHMKEHDCYDPRDVSTPMRRGREAQMKEVQEAKDEDDGFEWRGS